MEAFAGNVDAATSANSIARAHAGELPAQIVAAQVVAVDMLITLVGGDEERAAAELAHLLDQVPLGEGISEQMLRNVLTLPYVMVPDSRAYWEGVELGPTLRRSRSIARAFVAARAGDSSLLAGIDYPEPGVIAANLPGPWSVEFALRSVQAGRSEGRRLMAWLCEHWGDPARDSLRRFERNDDLGQIARDVVAQTPLPPSERIQLALLGTTTVKINGYETSDPDWRRERVRALIAWLVVQRRGTRDQLAAALWPDLDAEKSHKNLRTTLNYVHKLLEPRRSSRDATWFVQVDGRNVRLNPHTEVDVWRFVELLDAAEAEQRAGRTSASLPPLLEALALYQGDLSNDLDHSWLDLERIHLQSRFVLASCRAGELLTATGRSAEAIEVLRRALSTDQFHEASYVALAEAYVALGDTTSAQRILDLANSHVGDIADTRPSMR
jgi:DNA-binding SARP family transcriptional activator